MAEDADMDAVAAAIRSDPKAVAVQSSDLPKETEDDSPVPARREEPEDRVPAEQQEEQQEEEVDVDEIMLPVTVDGQVVDVAVKDLKADYSGRATIARRLQEATEYKQAVYTMGEQLNGLLQAHQGRLQQLDQALAQNAGAGIDWEKLRREEPGKYLLERERFREVQEARQALAREHQQTVERQQYLYQQHLQDVSRQEAESLVRMVPELADPKTSQEFMQAMVRTAVARGFHPGEVADVMDSRQLKVLADLTRLEARQAKARDNPAPKPAPLLRPTAAGASRPMSDSTKLQLAALARAKKSGRAEDVAATLLVRRK